ncbi:MAG: YceI family protein [Saprospiraceae bacterium]|nr:YceI family protein [Saprospiraceae bacterium]
MFLQKKSILLLLSILALLACKNEPKLPETAPSVPVDTVKMVNVPREGASTYIITEGVVNWSGAHTLKKDGHQGTIMVEGGTLLVNQGQLLSGTVTLDMNSIAVTDIKDPGERRDLESHLKDSDFFEVNKYPKAEFVIEEVLPGKAENFNWVLDGHLTMKGKKAPITIPVMIQFEGDMLQAKSPAFPINRTQWGVNFRSGILGTTRDKMIDDTVPLMLQVTAKKQQ